MDKRIIKVKVKSVAQSAQKLRLIVDTIRGMDVTKALATLKFLNRKGTRTVSKAIESGIANAMDRYKIDQENLVISKIYVDEAVTRKTGRFASRGRFNRILKRKSHLSLELMEK